MRHELVEEVLERYGVFAAAENLAPSPRDLAEARNNALCRPKDSEDSLS